jgi:hypothetical protein
MDNGYEEAYYWSKDHCCRKQLKYSEFDAEEGLEA